MSSEEYHDVIIVGGGPAGLSAALVLGRACRNVALFDDGRPRNYAAQEMHGYLTRDGMPPSEFRAKALEELSRYGVQVTNERIIGACMLPEAERRGFPTFFEVTLQSGARARCRKLLLATGIRDELPTVAGFEDLYGHGVHHCPYCDGWEYRGKPLVAFGTAKSSLGLALLLSHWSKEVTACSNGEPFDEEQRARAERNGITLDPRKLRALQPASEPPLRLQSVLFEDGEPHECAALFFNTEQYQRSPLPSLLGCEYDEGRDQVHTQHRQQTNVPGLFLAGDADGDVQFVIVAAGEGATAAVTINKQLCSEECG